MAMAAFACAAPTVGSRSAHLENKPGKGTRLSGRECHE
jgi:hypothetical protein